MIGKNPNKDYKEAIQFDGGSVNGYSPSSNPNLTAYKTKDGKRGVSYNGSIYYDNGNGRFVSSTGRDYLTYTTPKAPEPAPAPAPRPSSGGGSSSPSRSSGYGTTNPYAGNTGNNTLDASTLALMQMVSSLSETLAETRKVDTAEVSKPAGSGIAGTILSSSYVPASERKKKSYLTPISVS